jgi:hypothetical protein
MNFGLNCFPPRTFNQHFSCLYTVMKNLFIFYHFFPLSDVTRVRQWRHSKHNVRSVHIRAAVKRHGATGAATTSQRSMEKLYGGYIEYLFWCVLSSLVIGIIIYTYWGLCDALFFFSFLLRAG